LPELLFPELFFNGAMADSMPLAADRTLREVTAHSICGIPHAWTTILLTLALRYFLGYPEDWAAVMS